MADDFVVRICSSFSTSSCMVIATYTKSWQSVNSKDSEQLLVYVRNHPSVPCNVTEGSVLPLPSPSVRSALSPVAHLVGSGS